MSNEDTKMKYFLDDNNDVWAIEQNEKRDVSQRNNVYKDMDEWAKKEKGYDSYAEWYLDNMD